MAKKAKTQYGIKASKGDLVEHCGKNWTVVGRDFDPDRGHSYYLLRSGRGRSITEKWARSDKFEIAY